MHLYNKVQGARRAQDLCREVPSPSTLATGPFRLRGQLESELQNALVSKVQGQSHVDAVLNLGRSFSPKATRQQERLIISIHMNAQ